MQVGDLVLINDLCAISALVGTMGTVAETDVKAKWHPWPLVNILTIQGIIKFREDTPLLEVISENR